MDVPLAALVRYHRAFCEAIGCGDSGVKARADASASEAIRRFDSVNSAAWYFFWLDHSGGEISPDEWNEAMLTHDLYNFAVAASTLNYAVEGVIRQRFCRLYKQILGRAIELSKKGHPLAAMLLDDFVEMLLRFQQRGFSIHDLDEAITASVTMGPLQDVDDGGADDEVGLNGF